MRAGDFDSKEALKFCAVIFFSLKDWFFPNSVICFFAVIQPDNDEKEKKN